MIVNEIVATCSNPHVARAAVASIGGAFARRFSDDAAKRNLSSGAFAAGIVRWFSREAESNVWRRLSEAARGVDQPILSGLRYILERGLEADQDCWSLSEGWPTAARAQSSRQAWSH